MTKKVSIRWKSAGYSVLKNLNSSVLGIFCEFIDNSIQSYKEKKDQMLKIDPNYRLKIDISYDGEEIRIKDNAGGISEENFQRALEPANTPNNTDGLNEFGMGMKYAAVWISNEWELRSSAIGENIQRKSIFDYNIVTSKDIEELDVIEEEAEVNSHYTEVILRKLEKKRTYPWQEKYLKQKIAFIYRNFLREKIDFFSNWAEDKIELNVFGEKLEWKERGFLNQEWWNDRQVKQIQSDKIEWKYKFDWMKVEMEEDVLVNGERVNKTNKIEISGFIGILPDGKHKGNNGFTLFRRGRAVEGISDRIHPKDISGNSARGFKYIRLYGELHFRNVDISFDKTKLNINNERRDEIFGVIANMIKKIELGKKGKKYNIIQQADKHRATFSKANVKKSVDFLIKTEKKRGNLNIILPNENYDTNFEDKIAAENSKSFESITDSENSTRKVMIGSIEYEVIKNFISHDSGKLYIVNKDAKKITISINMKHPVFINQPRFSEEKDNLKIIVNILECLAISEIKAQNSGDKAAHVRHSFNSFISSYLK